MVKLHGLTRIKFFYDLHASVDWAWEEALPPPAGVVDLSSSVEGSGREWVEYTSNKAASVSVATVVALN